MKNKLKITLSILTVFVNLILMKAQQNYEIIAKIAPPSPDMSGIAVSSDNRVFFRISKTCRQSHQFCAGRISRWETSGFSFRKLCFPK